jgi:hypothetical protein
MCLITLEKIYLDFLIRPFLLSKKGWLLEECLCIVGLVFRGLLQMCVPILWRKKEWVCLQQYRYANRRDVSLILTKGSIDNWFNMRSTYRIRDMLYLRNSGMRDSNLVKLNLGQLRTLRKPKDLLVDNHLQWWLQLLSRNRLAIHLSQLHLWLIQLQQDLRLYQVPLLN